MQEDPLAIVVGGFVVRAQGLARLSGVVLVGSFGLNVALDGLPIRLLGLGTAGAGWAAILAQGAGALAYLWHVRRVRGVARIRSRRASVQVDVAARSSERRSDAVVAEIRVCWINSVSVGSAMVCRKSSIRSGVDNEKVLNRRYCGQSWRSAEYPDHGWPSP